MSHYVSNTETCPKDSDSYEFLLWTVVKRVEKIIVSSTAVFEAFERMDNDTQATFFFVKHVALNEPNPTGLISQKRWQLFLTMAHKLTQLSQEEKEENVPLWINVLSLCLSCLITYLLVYPFRRWLIAKLYVGTTKLYSRWKEEQMRKKARETLTPGFLKTKDEDDIPVHLLLCLNCRQSGHGIKDCPGLDKNPVPLSMPRRIATLREPIALPRRVKLRTRTSGNPSLPCSRCQDLPILEFFHEEPAGVDSRSHMGTQSPEGQQDTGIRLDSGLTYISGMSDLLGLQKDNNTDGLLPSIGSMVMEDLTDSPVTPASMLKADLGWVTSVTFRQDCPLCVMLVNTMADNVLSLDGYIVLCSKRSTYRYAQDSSGVMEAEKKTKSLFAAVNNDLDVPDVLWARMDLGRTKDAPDAIQLAEWSERDSNRIPFSGRPIADSIDMDLVNMWLYRCCENHGETCRSQRSISLDRIRLIDVFERKLVSYVDAERPDYIALSYVWGLGQQPKYPNKSTIPPLPATLEDAMELVVRLKIKYLWVDSICINQENLEDKESQIYIMDAIYEGAWLTIVASSGDSMDSGMARIRRSTNGSSQLQCQFNGKLLVSTMQTLRQHVDQSRWGTRAWTYQEALLSPRCLYISHDQVYFECNSAYSCESVDDVLSPYHNLDTSRRIPRALSGKRIFRNPFIESRTRMNWNKFEDYADAIFDDSRRDALHHYAKLLKEYSRRKMKQDEDSINAFGAVLKQIQKLWLRRGFFQGTPISNFSDCLLWEHVGPRRRRQGFPAWSWAGWEGALIRAHSRDKESQINKHDGNEWQRPYFKAYRAVGGRLEQLFGSSSTGRDMKPQAYSNLSFEDAFSEFQNAMSSLPPEWDDALPYIRAFMLSKSESDQDQAFRQLQEKFPGLVKQFSTGASTKDDDKYCRIPEQSQLPYDPFWELAQSQQTDVEFDSLLLWEGERESYVFLDCLTIKLTIDVKDTTVVTIDGIVCRLYWYSEDAGPIQQDGEQEVIVIDRRHGTLELLMVERKGDVTAIRIAAISLQLPDKHIVENSRYDYRNSQHRAYLELSNISLGAANGSRRFDSDEFHGWLIARGAQPRRRRLALI